MSCGAQHPNYPKTTCIYGVKCPPGRAHNGKHLRFWVNWYDSTNRPKSPEEARLDELTKQEEPPVEKFLKKKKRGTLTSKPESDSPPSSGSLFD